MSCARELQYSMHDEINAWTTVIFASTDIDTCSFVMVGVVETITDKSVATASKYARICTLSEYFLSS